MAEATKDAAASPPADAHAGEHHAHVVPWQLLTGILGVLIVLTVVTVAVAYVNLGEPANIILAMAIATVKASLVAAFFMHLRWDKPINTIILLFSLVLLALFLFFSILDTGQYQDSIDFAYTERKMNEARAEALADDAPAGEDGSGEGEAGGVHPDAEALQEWATGIFQPPLPEVVESEDNPVTDEKVALGRMLYYDARLSLANDVSCNTCHPLDEYGADGEPTSPGHEGQRGDFNSPSVYNAALHSMQFWDGREPTVESQAIQPLINPKEMAMGSHDDVVAKLEGIAGYAEPFAAAFPDAEDPITIENLGKAIGAFERKLTTPAPFDAFLEGDLTAMTDEQIEGLKVYKQVNCHMCHMGIALGGNMKQMLGLQKPWDDHPDSKKMFKAQSLRNVTETGPYLHDGSQPSLDVLVRKMAEYQLGVELTDDQTAKLLAFLEALKGDIPEELIAEPELPE